VNQRIDVTVNKILMDFKIWINQKLSPLYPWMFIVLFLFFSNAFKLLIPFSNIGVIQFPLIIIAYGMTFYMYYSLNLWKYAIRGTLYLILPVAVICVLLYYKDKITPVFKNYAKQFFKKSKIEEETYKIFSEKYGEIEIKINCIN